MAVMKTRLTILFEDPFWIGLYEREDAGCYEVCKITFGAEPKDCQVYEFLLQNWRRLVFSPAVRCPVAGETRVSHKRAQKLIRRQMERPALGTKAQQALQLQREQQKQTRVADSREARQAEQQRRFALRQEKRKKKHRGH